MRPLACLRRRLGQWLSLRRVLWRAAVCLATRSRRGQANPPPSVVVMAPVTDQRAGLTFLALRNNGRPMVTAVDTGTTNDDLVVAVDVPGGGARGPLLAHCGHTPRRVTPGDLGLDHAVLRHRSGRRTLLRRCDDALAVLNPAE